MSAPFSPFRTIAAMLCALFAALPCQADAPGALIRAGELKSAPFIDAEALTTLPDNTLLTVLGNQGGWSRVKTADGKTGWVRLLNVRIGTPVEQPTVKQAFAQIGGVIRTGTTKTAATTGVKGLSKEEITNAQPNPLEVRRLEAFKAKPVDSEKICRRPQLASRKSRN